VGTKGRSVLPPPRAKAPRPREAPEIVPLADGMIPLVGIDPGGTTGLCAAAVPRGTIFADDPYAGVSILWYDQVTGNEQEQVAKIIGLARWISMEYGGLFPLVIESFTLRMFSQDESLVSPVRIIAGVKQELRAENLSPAPAYLFQQSPSTAKTVCPDRRLKQWDLYWGGQQHARDALRHVVTFLRRAKERENLRQMAWDGTGRLEGGQPLCVPDPYACFRCRVCSRLGNHTCGCTRDDCPETQQERRP